MVILLPHSETTVGSINAAFLKEMKLGAMLVATGASTVLNEADVASAYTSGALSGIATDGWNYEPVEPENPLVALANDPSANVALTPHVAAGIGKLGKAEREIEYENILRLKSGSPLINRICAE